VAALGMQNLLIWALTAVAVVPKISFQRLLYVRAKRITTLA
jgi:hypothetical protein